MDELTSLPTNVSLRRFTINPYELGKGFDILTMDFPFGQAIERFKGKVQNRLKCLAFTEYVSVAYRQLNTALLTICPTLTHGFEYAGKQKPYRALACAVPSAPPLLTDAKNIRHIIREWALL